MALLGFFSTFTVIINENPQYCALILSVLFSIAIHSSKFPKSIMLPLNKPFGIFEEASTTTENLCVDKNTIKIKNTLLTFNGPYFHI